MALDSMKPHLHSSIQLPDRTSSIEQTDPTFQYGVALVANAGEGHHVTANHHSPNSHQHDASEHLSDKMRFTPPTS